MVRKIFFESKAKEQLDYWKKINNKIILNKIKKLIEDILKNPFTGIGKPEPLKDCLSGYWSRRIDQEHRLVYTITDDELIIVQCRFHY